MRPGVDRPFTRGERAWRIRAALEALREARDYLVAAGTPRAAARVRRAITSAEGALRHAERSTRPEAGEEQLEIPAILQSARAHLEAQGELEALEGLGRCEARLTLGIRDAGERVGEDAGNGGLREYQDALEARRPAGGPAGAP